MRLLAFLAISALSACGGGGGGGDGPAKCAGLGQSLTMSGPSNGPCAGCSTTNGGAVADADLYSYATVTLVGAGPQQIKTTSFTSTFPIGSLVGAFITPADSLNRTITLNTYLGETPVQSASGAALSQDETKGGTDASSYLYFQANAPFDAVELLFTGNGSETTTDKVYEICSNGSVE